MLCKTRRNFKKMFIIVIFFKKALDYDYFGILMGVLNCYRRPKNMSIVLLHLSTMFYMLYVTERNKVCILYTMQFEPNIPCTISV